MVTRFSTTSERIDNACAHMFFRLVTFGFVATAIISSFGLAAFFTLGISREPATASRIGEALTEFTSTYSGLVPHIDDHPALAPAETQSPSVVKAEIPPLSAAQGPPPSDTPPEAPGSRAKVEPLPEQEANATTQELSIASPTRGRTADETPAPEIDEAQETATQPLPLAEEVGATPDATRTVPSADEERDRLFRDFKSKLAIASARP
jgi:hypothetical protein